MDHKLIAQQTKMEAEALGHVTRALERATAWIVVSEGANCLLNHSCATPAARDELGASCALD